jgi:hypothetical protein
MAVSKHRQTPACSNAVRENPWMFLEAMVQMPIDSTGLVLPIDQEGLSCHAFHRATGSQMIPLSRIGSLAVAPPASVDQDLLGSNQ